MAVVASGAVAVAGCGSVGHTSTPTAPDPAAVGALPQAHPQAVQPTAGAHAAAAAGGEQIVGDVNAHAPSLAEVKKELKQLNLCGGAVSSADAAPVVQASGPGFLADPGTSQTAGQLPVLTARLDQLATALGVVIYGISGYRTPAHSVAVGGFADDPHTRGQANTEVNHIQLIPSGEPLTLAQSSVTLDPDPSCK